MPGADLSLNDSASGGHSYFEIVKGIEEPSQYDKEFHEEVNDY